MESETRVEKYLAEFKAQLESHNPHIKIYSRIQSSGNLVNDRPYFPGEDKVETYEAFPFAFPL